jgi:type II secretory pathway component PulJ
MPPRKASHPALPGALEPRFRRVRQELQQLDYFLKGTVLKRMMKCGQPQCACHRDPARRHGPYFEWTYKVQGKTYSVCGHIPGRSPYFEWTYKVQGKTVNVKLSPQAAPLYQAATKQHRKLKAVLARMERLSRTALARLAKQAENTA